MKFIEYPDRELMMIDLADRLSSELKNALLTHERATFCVPGGTTPGPAFDSLSASKIDWSRVTVLLGDERWVPEDHPRSNTRLVRKRLLVNQAASAQLQSLHTDAATPEEALEELGDEVRKVLPINVLLLGMGGDMHTASIFPGADRLDEALADTAPPVMALRAEAAAEPRMTLTAPVLQGALSTHILITGPEKRAALERARSLSPREAPVKIVLNDATVHWAE
ncbi:6-phosphogluconolactonase [Tropicimonas isoalkanivorans]|uniref:6-phosphogluconolactonase n=1 Tax=Tropicimonas isoalkanivorans TaxID=441112 RepID=A0A1I1DT81_9RHOB|nr:6-phosphogluconolactonase [Tropicimonas isoalkanivorans]SFB76228.1 6-phosphogluconolactonase [Tropicimonas isoalkanivorans]